MFSKRILYIFCFLLCCGTAFAQQPKRYFVYIQSESGKPFYVRSNGQLLSGTASGYIIIPGLREGRNDLVIGFPKNEFPEQHFSISLSDNKDEGYLFRNAGNGRFELYNLQSFQVIRAKMPDNNAGEALASNATSAATMTTATPDTLSPGSAPANAADTLAGAVKPQKTTADTSDFAAMLNRVSGKGQPQEVPASGLPAASGVSGAASDSGVSRAASDSGVSNLPVLTRVPATDTANTTARSSATAPATPQAIPADTTEANEGLSATTEQEKEARKRKYRPERKNQPQFITYLPGGDTTGAIASAPANTVPDSGLISPATEDSSVLRHKKRERRELQAGENVNPVPVASTGAEGGAATVNSDCGSVADEKEFQKTRRKIAMQKDDAGMLREAGKYFSSTCFSVAQVKSIAYLFITDEYRYKFLDMAYAHIYDPGNFPGLEKVLSDPYYIGRFRAMVRK